MRVPAMPADAMAMTMVVVAAMMVTTTMMVMAASHLGHEITGRQRVGAGFRRRGGRGARGGKAKNETGERHGPKTADHQCTPPSRFNVRLTSLPRDSRETRGFLMLKLWGNADE